MMKFIDDFDVKVAAGLLARAAISLEDPDNPAAHFVLDNEAGLRDQLYAAARSSTGLTVEDRSPEALALMGEFLDEQADVILGPLDFHAAFSRLSDSGALPTDMYVISTTPSLSEWIGGHAALEYKLIEETIRQPDRLEHFGRTADVFQPSLVSLFYKSFATKFPFKDFNLLVTASRNGENLNISGAWRIYPAILDISKAKSLVEVLHTFALNYGTPVEWEGKSSSFFLTAEPRALDAFQFQISGKDKPQRIGISCLWQNIGSIRTAAIVLIVDMLRYNDLLDRMAVPTSDFVTEIGLPTADTLPETNTRSRY